MVYTDGDPAELLRDTPEPDALATTALVARANPGWSGEVVQGSSLHEELYPGGGTVFAGSFPGVDVLCDRQAMVEHPSKLPRHLLRAGAGRRVILHAMHSVEYWFAFAVWENGTLVRSLSLSPGGGVVEDIGDRFPFEAPFWAGEHPVRRMKGRPDQSSYALPFHPLELGGDAALRVLLGFSIEGLQLASDLDAATVRLAGFRVPDLSAIPQADVEAFMKSHRLRRYTYGPDGTLIPIEG